MLGQKTEIRGDVLYEWPLRSFLQKKNERILLYYYETSGRLVFVRFSEKIEDTKKTFRNYLSFRCTVNDLKLFVQSSL